MNKTILKNFAIDSRKKLMQDIKNKAAILGITEEEIASPLFESTSDMLMFDIKSVNPYIIHNEEIKQYHKLKAELERRTKTDSYITAYTTLIEEVAYTWFNRLIAIRFMEVNNYLPDKMRVLSSRKDGVNEPEFVTNYRDTSLDFSDIELDQLAEWKMDASALAMDKIFHLLFIKQCNSLNANLPELFEKTDDYAELLLTISYNDPDGVLYKLVHDIPEDYFDVETDDGNGQVEIIGWMYQYYNSEKKDEVFARPKSQKILKEDIPAATQLFTPDWIARYMVQNSLGRLWIEKLLANGEERTEKQIAEDFGWKYYISEAEQDEEVKEQLIEIRNDRKDLKLEGITFIDPAMGSFHIGVYAFDVFMQLYESQGYTSREAATSIIENNLYGIDIDKRAYQLSYFACMMKGRQYNRRILNGEVKTNLYTIVESNNINRNHLDYLGNNIKDKKEWNKVKEKIIEILDLFIDAREYGSILQIEKGYDFKSLKEFVKNTKEDIQVSFDTVGIEDTQNNILAILNIMKVLSQKYSVVSTNPPYLGSRGMNPKLGKYVRKYYSDSKSDLFAVFMERCKAFTISNGFYTMITQHAWMFLSSYEKLREELTNSSIINMLHLGTRAFEEIGGEVVQTTTFVYKNTDINNYQGSYIRLVDFDNSKEKEIKILEAIANPDCGYYYQVNEDNFEKIPGSPVAYWSSENLIEAFNSKKLHEVSITRKGMATGLNDKHVRKWYEVYNLYIGYDLERIDAKESSCKWFPYANGGYYRKWYGNYIDIVNWENDGYILKIEKTDDGKRIRAVNLNLDYIFKRGISWTSITSGNPSMRLLPKGFLFSSASNAMFSSDIEYYLALLNSQNYILISKIINPTLNSNPGDIGKIPALVSERYYYSIKKTVKQNIQICKIDWDCFETSWDFEVHPLIYKNKQESLPITMGQSYENHKKFANNNFTQLKQNEEELNRIFIEIYGLQDEITPEVLDKDITITRIFDHKNEIYDDIKGNRYIQTKEDVIKSFISYAVGCIFGRYSLDTEGLAYAGGDWDSSKYESFIPTKDNIILITEEDYFEDDLLNRFVEFVRVTYGAETLDENLIFIADALDGKGSPKEVIRNYILKDFYKDHVKTYKKRPIYWLYDSGKQNGFKALIYMHRYDEDTTGKLRIDYLHKVQKAYERRMDNLKYEIANNKNAREVSIAEKELTKLTKQLKETKDYDEKIGHLAVERIAIDLDDGVKVNYDKVQTDEKGKNLKILAKI